MAGYTHAALVAMMDTRDDSHLEAQSSMLSFPSCPSSPPSSSSTLGCTHRPSSTTSPNNTNDEEYDVGDDVGDDDDGHHDDSPSSSCQHGLAPPPPMPSSLVSPYGLLHPPPPPPPLPPTPLSSAPSPPSALPTAIPSADHGIADVGTKVCCVCEQELPLTAFYMNNCGVQGRHSRCKGCLQRKRALQRSEEDCQEIRHAEVAATAAAAETPQQRRRPRKRLKREDATSASQSTARAADDSCGCDTLYVMQNSRIPGELKIGRTSRSVASRAQDLCASQNFRIDPVCSFHGFGHIELRVHEILKTRRVTEGSGREWFKVSLQEAVAAIMAAMIS